MPQAAPKPCAHSGCGVAVHGGGNRCPAHKLIAGRFADDRRGSRHARGYGTAWDKTRARILRRDAGLCQPCMRNGITTPGCNTVDHRVNKAQGGTDDHANLQTICPTCHVAKTRQEAIQGRGRGVEESRGRGLGTGRPVEFFTAAESTPRGLGRRGLK